MSTTPVINEKNFEIRGVFSYFVEMLLGWPVYTHIMIFYLILTLICRQSDFVASVSDEIFLMNHTVFSKP